MTVVPEIGAPRAPLQRNWSWIPPTPLSEIMKESELIANKALHMTDQELDAELNRITAAMKVAASKGALKRYETREEILRREILRRARI